MHWLEIKPLKKVFARDHELLAKAPLIPNRYLCEVKGYTLALYKVDGDEPRYFLKTDNHPFFKQYRPYYEKRFEAKELENGFTPDSPMTLVFGGECQTAEQPEPKTQNKD